ncbi:MAG: amidohydrolase [Bdellovibrionales bacterium]|nr:amidohydrolase [Bdellovibrionales bacterium]
MTAKRGNLAPFTLGIALANAALFVAVGCATKAVRSGSDAIRAPASGGGELLLRGGHVVTLDPRAEARADPRAYGPPIPPPTAVAVRDGKILYVGSDAEAAARLSRRAETIDLAGATVLPSFIDAHIHPIDSGVEFAECYLYTVDTVDELVAKVRDCVNTSTTGWLRGSGWAQTLFNGQPPEENPLDAIETTGPIALMSSDGHSYWVNHVALRIAGVTASTPDPRDGVIGRKPGSLEPNGFLFEGAMGFIDRLLPKRTYAEQRRGLLKALSIMRENGITAFHDAYVTEDHLRVYSGMIERGEFPGLVATAMYADSNLPVESQMEKFRRLRRTYENDRLRVGTIKIFLDGTLEDHTAALLRPYLGVRGRRGQPISGALQWPIDKLNRMVELADRDGFAVHFHAIGDRAVRSALDAIEFAQRTNRTGGRRHQIAHLQLIDPADIPRFARLGVIANFQPLWAERDDFIAKLAEPVLGPARSRWIYPIGSVVRTGAHVAFGSDWAVTSLDPRAGMETAVRRAEAGDPVDDRWTPEQRIDVRAAMNGYTTGSAYANFWENRTGMLRPGMRADFVILDRDPSAVVPSEISKIKIRATYSEGVRVYPSP